MARKMITQLIDDLTGEVIDDKGETIEFSYRGKSHQIDLSKDNAKAFDKAMASYVSAASPVARSGAQPAKGKSTTKADKDQVLAMRNWLREHGHQVSDRGRIAANLQELYHLAH